MSTLVPARARRARHEGGSAAIEVIGVAPVVVVLVICLLQGVAAAFAVQGTNQAVRDGARALSLGRSAEVAIENSLPGGLQPRSITYLAGGEGVRLEVRIPRILPFPQMTVVREAVMPRTSP